jgi:equilibrative nucleoside transporter 1/2/3
MAQHADDDGKGLDDMPRPLVGADVADLQEPADVGGCGGNVYVVFFILGVGQMLPWNVFINATSYFATRFEGSMFSSNFENFFSIAFNICSVLGVLLASKYQGLIAPRTRVIVPLIGNAVVFLATTALVLVKWNGDAAPMFYITICVCVASGCFVAMLQSGIFGLAAQFPMQYAQAIMGGQGMAGMSVSLVFMLTTYWSSDNSYEGLKWSSFTYFGIASGFVLLCTIAYYHLEKSEFALYYANFQPIKQQNESGSLNSGADHASMYIELPEKEQSAVGMSPAQKRAAAQSTSQTTGPSMSQMLGIYHMIMPSAWAVFGVFFITLGLFPSLTVHIAPMPSSHYSTFFSKLWVPFSFVNFNVCDFFGRTMAGKTNFLQTPFALLMASILRVGFAPLFMFCNRENLDLGFQDLNPHWPVVFKSDWFPVLFMMLFATSNGYVSTRCMMLGPAKVPLEQQEVAGPMMVIFLVSGLALGSAASFGFS